MWPPAAPAPAPTARRTSRAVLRGRLQYSASSSWPAAELSSSSLSRSSSLGDRQASSSKKERRGTPVMSRYRATRCHTEQGWGSRLGQGTSAGTGGLGERGRGPAGSGAGGQALLAHLAPEAAA